MKDKLYIQNKEETFKILLRLGFLPRSAARIVYYQRGEDEAMELFKKWGGHEVFVNVPKKRKDWQREALVWLAKMHTAKRFYPVEMNDLKEYQKDTKSALFLCQRIYAQLGFDVNKHHVIALLKDEVERLNKLYTLDTTGIPRPWLPGLLKEVFPKAFPVLPQPKQAAEERWEKYLSGVLSKEQNKLPFPDAFNPKNSKVFYGVFLAKSFALKKCYRDSNKFQPWNLEIGQKFLDSIDELGKTDNDYRQVILLRHQNGYSWKTTASIMDTQVPTVERMYNEACKMLKLNCEELLVKIE